MMQIYVDMDGVLADFDRHHEAVFGVRASKEADNVDWNAVRGVKDFYLHIPPMLDMWELWRGLCLVHTPIILTGIPSSVPEAKSNKTRWIKRHFGKPFADSAICCPSKEKCLHAKPGDVLIDDWVKYKHLWEKRGGVWITHVSAAQTLRELDLYSRNA